MSFQSLKFKITANLAFIILLSVLLSDFIIITVIQKSLVQERVANAKLVLSLLSNSLNDQINSNSEINNSRFIHEFSSSSIIYFYLKKFDGLTYSYGDPEHELLGKINQVADQTIETGQCITDFYGNTFGVFAQQKKYAIISEPISGTEISQSGIKLIVIQFDHIYQALRNSQKIIILYVIANFILLLLFAVYRLSQLIIRPIHRFIKMTDDFRVKDRLYFTHGKNYQEFNQLSKALNHMVDTIETDKENLRCSFTELEKANKELTNAQHEIVRAEKLASVGRLSTGIAHEIGNPIGIVLGYLDLLKSRPKLKNDEIGQDFLKRAQDEINRINTIIRQLLDFSRSASEQLTIVSMNDLINDVVAIMTTQPFMSKILLEKHLLDDAPDTVKIDSDQMRQVLVNLIINAVDSVNTSGNRDKGVIQFSTEVLDENNTDALKNQLTMLLKVTDNGTGISNEDIENIFDPFFTTKEPGKGTGLGLSVSYMIIEQAGGRIAVKSDIGQGTCMMIYLPICLS